MITQQAHAKVKDLLDKGVLSMQQADELMDALSQQDSEEDHGECSDNQAKPGSGSGEKTEYKPHAGEKNSAWPFIDSLAEGTLGTVSAAMNSAFAGIRYAIDHVQGATQNGNKIAMSKADHPTGSRYDFSDNEIRMCKLNNVALNEAQMKGNKILGSSISGLMVSFGAFNRNSVNAASVVDVSVENGMVADCTVNGSKVRAMAVKEDSMVFAAKIDASKVSDLRIGGESKMNDCSIKCCNCHSLSIVEHSSIIGLSLGGSNTKDLKMQGTQIANLSILASKASKIAFVKSIMTNVVVGASMIDNLQVLNAKLTNCEFIKCSFFNTVIRDVDLSDICMRGAVIENEIITCKEDLFKFL